MTALVCGEATIVTGPVTLATPPETVTWHGSQTWGTAKSPDPSIWPSVTLHDKEGDAIRLPNWSLAVAVSSVVSPASTERGENESVVTTGATMTVAVVLGVAPPDGNIPATFDIVTVKV